MPNYNSLNALIKAISEAAESALQAEVFETIKETMLSHIASDVYGAYPKPKMYDRRKLKGGFSDPANIENVGSGLTLEIINKTPPNPEGNPEPTTDKNLAEVIETGVGYDYFSPGARPYVENTIEDLKSSGAHVDAFKQGMLRQGFKIE